MALPFYTGGHNSQVFRNPYLSYHPWINLPVQLRLISRRLTSRFCSVGSINPSTVVTYGLHLLTFEQILYQHNLFWTSFLTFRGDLYPVSLNLYGLNSSGYTLLLGLLYPTGSSNLLSTKTKSFRTHTHDNKSFFYRKLLGFLIPNNKLPYTLVQASVPKTKSFRVVT